MSVIGELKYDGKVMIATPFYNMQAWAPYVNSLVQTISALQMYGVKYEYCPIYGDSYVERARNTICAKFLESDSTDLFFIDSDEDWDVLGFLRVLTSPMEVIGASYKMKNNWDAWTAHLKLHPDGSPVGKLITEDTAILKADAIPAGFMKVTRGALERFARAYPKFRYNDTSSDGGNSRQYVAFFECEVRDGIYVGEDVNFCRRWQEIGGEVWVEPKVSVTHYGVQGFHGNLDKHLRTAKTNGEAHA